jgi:hypothetical protein
MPLKIDELESLTGSTIKTGFLNTGAQLYSDNRNVAFASVPTEIAGQPYVMTAESDKGATGNAVLKFTVNRPSYVYILYDSRGTAAKGGEPPAWVSNGFVKLDQAAEVSGGGMGEMAVYRSGMQMSGQITVGGNADPPAQGYQNNYVVAVAPAEEHGTDGTGVVALSVPSETGGTEGYEGSMGFSFTVMSREGDRERGGERRRGIDRKLEAGGGGGIGSDVKAESCASINPQMFFRLAQRRLLT